MLLLQGMSLVPAVTELILAELLYLQYDNPTRPVYMYINSAGVTVSPQTAQRIYTYHSTGTVKESHTSTQTSARRQVIAIEWSRRCLLL